jgi:hypothetical protein
MTERVNNQRVVATQQERMRILDDMLARLIPESRTWERKRYPRDTVAREVTYCIEAASPAQLRDRSMVIHLRHDRDIQVEYHIDGERKRPFETFFLLPAGEEKDAIASIVAFVADILAERLVLVDTKGIFGERRFVKRDSLSDLDRQRLSRIISWLGSYDWRTPA